MSAERKRGNNLFYFLVKFFRKIRKVLEWIPVIWKDEEWDQEYFYEIMAYKLKRMREYFMAEGFLAPECYKEMCSTIQEAEECLNRVIADNYSEEEQGAIDRKWGKQVHTFEKDGRITHLIKDEKYYEDISNMMKLECEKKEWDLDRFCFILKKYSQGWWS